MKRPKTIDLFSWRRARRRAARRERPKPTPSIEPDHDQPWVPRSALADRVRRSPRT